MLQRGGGGGSGDGEHRKLNNRSTVLPSNQIINRRRKGVMAGRTLSRGEKKYRKGKTKHNRRRKL